MIKTFRGLIADDTQDTINLHTNDGKTGYRIVKFHVFPADPGNQHYEAILKIYKISQTTITSTVDFSDQTLIGAAFYQDAEGQAYPSSDVIVFDNEVFNQDIYITYKATSESTGTPMNYYIELEQMPLDLNESTVATLQSIRNA